MLSHDARIRCDLVDLYYKLYGIKRPTCLPIPELVGVLKQFKLDDSRKKSHLIEKQPIAKQETKKSPPIKKETTEEVIVDYPIDVKVRSILNLTIFF